MAFDGTQIDDIEWPWTAIILRYCDQFGSFRGALRKSGWLAINIFSPVKCHKVGYIN